MESYIPLVKAIIISTMFMWGTSEVVITDQYIYKENANKNTATGNETKDYKVYDLKSGIIHFVDQEMQFRFTHPALDTFHREVFSGIGMNVSKTTSLDKADFGEYKCKRETKAFQRIVSLDGHSTVIAYDDISYFAKIEWLDKILDTQEKRKFAGFGHQEYSPYHYLIYQYEQYPKQQPKDKILRIIEKKEVDTAFIHNLLSLPLRVN